MKRKGFSNLQSDPCDDDDLEIVTVWVDDLLLFATSDRILRHLREDLKSIFNITNLGEPSKIVGIKITHQRDSIMISQPPYVDLILHKYAMTNANPVLMPLDPNVKLEPNTEVREPNRSNDYAFLIGSLQYLTIATCPDITYAVNQLAAYYGIMYRDDNSRLVRPTDSNTFYGFSDATFTNADDRKLISGYVFLSNTSVITWMSKKQATIALSLTEAEYVTLLEAARDVIWLRHLYGELGFIQKEPVLLLGDNDGSIFMTKNPQFHKCTKHINL